MTIWKGVAVLTARWPSGGNVSDPVPLDGGRVPCALVRPVTWTEADIAIELEIDGAWQRLTSQGGDYTARVKAGACEALDPTVVWAAAAATRMRLVSLTVAQAAGAEVTVVLTERGL